MSTRMTAVQAAGFGALLTLPRQLATSLILRSAERRSLAQLRRLDDRLLQDVGLTRAEMRELTDRA